MSASTTSSEIDLVNSWDTIAVGFARTQRRLLASVEAIGLAGPSFEALRLLLHSDNHRMPMSRLARDLTMTAGGLTKLADRLARDGLIDRRNSSDDRRVVYAALTAEGEQLATRALTLYRASLREHVMGLLQEEQLIELAATMQTLGDAHRDVHVEEEVLTARDPALPERRKRGRESS
jgi:DNA-binding MarR family transcriptional regulator